MNKNTEELWEKKAFKEWQSASDFHKPHGVNAHAFLLGYKAALRDFREILGDQLRKEIEGHKVSTDDFIKAHTHGLSRASYLLNEIEPTVKTD